MIFLLNGNCHNKSTEKQLFIRESELRPYSTKEKNLSLQRIKKIDNT